MTRCPTSSPNTHRHSAEYRVSHPHDIRQNPRLKFLFVTDLPQAATLTTTKMRDGLSPTDWVEKNATLLKDLQFKYLDGKVIKEESDEAIATVTVQVRLYLVIGEVRRVETFTLKKVEGRWLIEGQEIQEERVIGRTI